MKIRSIGTKVVFKLYLFFEFKKFHTRYWMISQSHYTVSKYPRNKLMFNFTYSDI